jgi:hypothetical protein
LLPTPSPTWRKKKKSFNPCQQIYIPPTLPVMAKPKETKAKKTSKNAESSTTAIQKSKSSTKMWPAVPPTLMELVFNFCYEHGFSEAAHQIRLETTKREKTKDYDSPVSWTNASQGHPKLVEVFQQWKATAKAPEDKMDVDKLDDSDSDSTSDDSSDSTSDSDSDSTSASGSDSDSDSEEEAQPTKAPTSKTKPKVDSGSDSDSDSSDTSDSSDSTDSDEEEETIAAAIPLPESDSSASDSDSSDSVDSDSDSSTQPTTSLPSKAKTVVETAGAAIKAGINSLKRKVEVLSESSDSDTDTDSDSDSDDSESDSKPATKKTKTQATNKESTSEDDSDSSVDSDSDSDSSDSSGSDSDNDSATTPASTLPPIAKAPKTGSHSDSSVTLMHQSPPLPLSKAEAKQAKSTERFQRIKADQITVDPRFSSNAYQSYDYADKAFRDLSVTKGKGFTKEKNKKKRGSYRGGPIDSQGVNSIKFDD